MDRETWQAAVHGVAKELDTAERHTHRHVYLCIYICMCVWIYSTSKTQTIPHADEAVE